MEVVKRMQGEKEVKDGWREGGKEGIEDTRM